MTRANYSSEVLRPRGQLIGPGRVVDKRDEFFMYRSGVAAPSLSFHHLSSDMALLSGSPR